MIAAGKNRLSHLLKGGVIIAATYPNRGLICEQIADEIE